MNEKYYIIALLLFISIVSYSQESKFSYGFALDVGVSAETSEYDSFKDYFPGYTEIALGYELGAIVEYKLTDEFSLQSGLKYARYGFNTGKLNNFYSHNPSDVGVDYIKYEGGAYCLAIPLKAMYYRDFKKSKFFISVGYSPSVNINNKVRYTYYYPRGKEETGLLGVFGGPKKLHFVGEFGIGWEESISERASLFIYPNLKVQTIKKSQYVRDNRRFLFYGISLGLKIK